MVTGNDDERRRFYEGVELVPDHLLAQWTARLRGGERGKAADGIARAVLRDFIPRQWLNKPHSKIALDWLADGLNDLLDHADPLRVFGLAKRPANRPADPQVSMDVAWWIALAVGRGYSSAEAKEMAADLFGRDTKTIERDKKRAAPWVVGMNPKPDWDIYFSHRKPPRPLPRPRDEK